MLKVSLIVPTYNRKNKLKACIDSISRQKLPNQDYELIIVDDCSLCDISGLIKEAKFLFTNFEYIRLPSRGGPAQARNAGALRAKAEIIAFTDDDCVLEENCLEKVIKSHLANKDKDIIGGITFVCRQGLRSKINQFMINGAIFNYINNKREIIFFPTCNVSLKRRVFERDLFINKFLGAGGEDLEFFWRLYKKGYKFFYDKDIKIYHNLDDSFTQFLSRPYRYGKENYLVSKIHRDHPALQDIKINNLAFFLLSLFKEALRCPLLGIKLANRFAKNLQHKYINSFFYFVLFRLAYLAGSLKGLKYYKFEHSR